MHDFVLWWVEGGTDSCWFNSSQRGDVIVDMCVGRVGAQSEKFRSVQADQLGRREERKNPFTHV